VFPHVEGRYLQAVVVLAEELNFTRAAHILRISQPALSKQINELEDQCQVRLFVREKGAANIQFRFSDTRILSQCQNLQFLCLGHVSPRPWGSQVSRER